MEAYIHWATYICDLHEYFVSTKSELSDYMYR